MTKTKKEIVDAIVGKTGYKNSQVKKIVQLTLNTITNSLVKGERIELRNFGVFKVKVRKAKKGRNPRTGETVPVPERKVVVFKPGLELKKKVR